MKEYFGIKLDPLKLPYHIAIILDGNRRWAKSKNLSVNDGHKAGIENIKRILKFSKQIGIKILSVYAFSTENWKRSPDEINFLMNVVADYFKKNLDELNKEGIKILHSGRKSMIPSPTLRVLNDAVKLTRNNSQFVFNICFNYGGRQEIIDGIKKLFKKVLKKEFNIKKLNENSFREFLYTNLPDPDLIIRTSGEIRTSNFLLWQQAYSEWYFTKTYWPDFDEKSLIEAIKDYQNRERRFGK